MRKNLLIFIFTFISAVYLKSQTVFLPHIGTKWYYVFKNPYSVNVPVEYIKDSVYQGEAIKVLRVETIFMICTNLFPQRVFIRQRNDSVWFLHSRTNNTWQLLIDFNAQPGQSWSYQVVNDLNQLKTFSVTVNATGTIQANSLVLKTYSVSYTGALTLTSVIYERIGEKFYLFPLKNDDGTCHDVAHRSASLCYEDYSLGLAQLTWESCDHLSHLGIETAGSDNTSLTIFPNPFDERLSIQTLTEGKLSLFDPHGKVLLEHQFVAGETKLDTKLLNAGVYILQLSSDSGTARKKIFKLK